MKDIEPRQRVLLIGAAVLLLAGLGYAGSRWLSQQPVNDAEAANFAQQSESLSLTMQDELMERLGESTGGMQQERLDSPLGQALLRQCLEWTEFQENHPSDANEQNQREACDNYSHYIATGEDPR